MSSKCPAVSASLVETIVPPSKATVATISICIASITGEINKLNRQVTEKPGAPTAEKYGLKPGEIERMK